MSNENEDEQRFAVTEKAIVELQPDPGTNGTLRRIVEQAAQAKREAEASGSPVQIYLKFLSARGYHGPMDDEDRTQLTQAELDLTSIMLNSYFGPLGMAVSDISARCLSATASDTGEEQEWEIYILIK